MEKEKLVQTVKLAQKGDSDALNELFNAFYNDVYYFALKNVKDEDLACDITQEAFVEIINTLGNLKEPAAFVTWMKQITYHQCTRYFKKKKEVLVDENEDGDTIFDTMTEERTEFIPDEAVDQADFRTTIMGMIDQLPDEQRAATMMYYFDEMSVKEIAQAQGVGENTVKGRLSYSRKAIKKSVEDYEKKNNVKLHCVGLLPLLLWLFRNYGKAMPVASAKAVAEGVSTATGVGICVAAGSGAVTTTVTTTAAVGLAAKLAAIPLAAKIGAGILAVALIAGAGTAVVMGNRDKDTPTETTKNTEPQHTHSYTAITVDATCTENGKVDYACECGDAYSEELPATGHSYTASSTTATCTEPGVTVYTCECGDSYSEEVAATGHTYTASSTTATCTEAGVTVYTCTCGDTYSEEVAATGHSYTASSTTATCTQNGITVYTCTCGDTYSEEVAATGHSYTASSTTATCTENGVIVYTCTCGDTYSEEIAATGHKYNSSVIKPTCTMQGVATYLCMCGESYVEFTDATGHNWGQWDVIKRPTVEAEGQQSRVCSECSKSESESLPKVDIWEYATQTAKLLNYSTGFFYSIDEIDDSGIKKAAFIGLHWEDKSNMDSETKICRYRVSDLDDFTLRYFGRTYDWKKSTGVLNEKYDSATDTVEVTLPAAEGREPPEFLEITGNGNGTYTAEFETTFSSMILSGVLRLKETKYGYMVEEYFPGPDIGLDWNEVLP